jgi:hypothetical protein
MCRFGRYSPRCPNGATFQMDRRAEKVRGLRVADRPTARRLSNGRRSERAAPLGRGAGSNHRQA